MREERVGKCHCLSGLRVLAQLAMKRGKETDIAMNYYYGTFSVQSAFSFYVFPFLPTVTLCHTTGKREMKRE